MKKVWFFFLFSLLFLAWCGSTPDPLIITAHDYQFNYQGKEILQERPLTSQDDPDIRAIYVETGSTTSFKDSLIIIEKYNQWKKPVVFSRDAITTLENQGLTIQQQVEKTAIINCKGQQIPARIISYSITSGFIAGVPKLYVAELFMEKDDNTITIRSHTTEKASEQQAMIKNFQNLECK